MNNGTAGSIKEQSFSKSKESIPEYEYASPVRSEIDSDVIKPRETDQKSQQEICMSEISQQENGQKVQNKGEKDAVHESSMLSMNRKKSLRINFCGQQCPLCLQSVATEEFCSFTLCSHKFCIKCSLQFVKREIQHQSKIQCPTKGCGASINFQNPLLAYLTADQLEKLREIEKIQTPKKPKILEILQNEIQIQVDQRSLKNDKDENQEGKGRRAVKTSIKVQQEIEMRIGDSKDLQKSASMSLDSHENIMSSGVHFKESEVKIIPRSNRGKGNKNPNPPPFPKIAFSYLCEEVWLNKWSRFLKMLPISLLIIVLAILVLAAWTLWVTIYFVLIWILFVPSCWAIYQIWGCFQRSFKNHPCLQKPLFTLCLFGFPLIFCFFYLLTLGIILFDGLFKADMRPVIEGKVSLIASCRKVHLTRTRSMDDECNCKFVEKCRLCENKNFICCLIL